MMEKRNLVEKQRTPRLNQQEALDGMEKSAVALFKPATVKDAGKKCAKRSK